MDFAGWLKLNESRSTSAKQGLYPPAYSMVFAYPSQDVIVWAADSVTYMDKQDLEFKVTDKFFVPYVRKGVKLVSVGGAWNP